MGSKGLVFPMMIIGLLGAVVYGSAMWLLHLSDSVKPVSFTKKEMRILVGMSWGNATVITGICRLGEMLRGIPEESRVPYPVWEGVLLGLLAGGLLAAAWMDVKSCYVYNYVWWWCLLWIILLLWLSQVFPPSFPRISFSQVAAVVGFIVLQQCFFAKMYGRADSHAFSVCAFASCYFCGNMIWFFIHMLLAVILLAVVQLWNKNVTRDGRLYTPKPFVPYIIITFWLEILCMLCLEWKAYP